MLITTSVCQDFHMSKKTLNKANLTELGLDRLADLLLEVSTGSAEIKRRLRLELSHHLGPEELGREVSKRLASIRKSKTRAGWRKRKALVKDLQTQVDMICDKIAVDDPSLAFGLLWDFLSLAPFIYERVDDSRGNVAAVFRSARDRFVEIAPNAKIEPVALASQIWEAVQDDPYHEFDGIIGLLAPTLGDVGLEHLKTLISAYRDEPHTDSSDEHEALIFLRSLRDENSYPSSQKTREIKSWFQEIAVAQGDTETYVAQFTDQDLTRPAIAAEVAQLWLDAARNDDALNLLEAADLDGSSDGHEAWDAAYIKCLLDVDRFEDAQAHRWARFEQTLNASQLRDYLKPLPDFEDIEIEDEAKAFARTFPQIHTALGFFLKWPDLSQAAGLVEGRITEIDGDLYWFLIPAVEALRQRHPLATVLLLRSMIDFALGGNHASRYGYAAEHLMDCEMLDAEIVDYNSFLSHEDYVKQLQLRHDRKTSFWSKLRL